MKRPGKKMVAIGMAAVVKGALVFYREAISPYLPHVCRYRPSCSIYALEALERHGVLKGFYLAARRILRCHPWGRWGYDPVPPVSGETMAGGIAKPKTGTL